MRRREIAHLVVGIIAPLWLSLAPAAAWELPADKATIPAAQVEEILAGKDFPATTGYSSKIDYVDFDANGRSFTQVVMRLDPEKPLLHNGRKVVLVATEEGSSSINGFLTTDEGKEGIGVWLAKRGVTFIGLNRIGRWNFFAADGSGSWETIPLNDRMPIFSRHQKAYWSSDDWTSQAAGKTSSSSGSEFVRFPKPGTALYDYMVAATPVVFVDGFEKGLRHVLSEEERRQSLLLYWGFSTGGAFMWPLADRIQPDGFLNWGTSPPGIAYFYGAALHKGRWDWLYEKSALRVRGRGRADFEFYNTRANPAEKDARWERNLKEPRFKAAEDSLMFFNIGALSEGALRLYTAEFLPAERRQLGYAALLQEQIAIAEPGPGLKGVPVWDMNGTLDEVYPPAWMEAARDLTAEATGTHRITRIEGFNHSIVERQVQVIGSVWLRAIQDGFFDR
ncbi:hypothetical protein [Ancylobacter terrae]|uniref:hypothetical protein n=1 Tax=Ancylobacter sp. sgz301288 TaxID=3342077 RepID=UPI00385D8047